jgi:glycosyltransferase involved in cell wall biosynthesis
VDDKRILVITYYWPPSAGSGVQRWLKFVKYLPSFGWKPYVFTPENPSFAIRDESLIRNVPPEAEVIRFPIWEPYDIFFKASRVFGTKKEAKPTELISLANRSLFQRISTWIRANLFIPDPRVFWVRPSVKFLQKFLQEKKINVIVTTGPPHSMHLIGYRLKKNNPSLRWIADFRDPWSRWDLLDSFKLSEFAASAHKRLEYKVLSTADEVISVTPSFVKGFEELGNRHVHLITNGYDEEDFSSIVYQRSGKFIIRHVGIVNEKCDPRPFMFAVKDLLLTHSEFAGLVAVEFNGEVHPDFRNFIESDPELTRVTNLTGNVPHANIISLYGLSGLLVLIMTGYKDTGIIPGKVFEYLATGVPILSVGNVDGDAALFLKQTGVAQVFDSDEREEIKESLLKSFFEWKASGKHIKHRDAEKYSRRAITGQLSSLLETLGQAYDSHCASD